MVERFENLDILQDWVKEKIQKKSCRGIEHDLSEKILEQSRSAVERSIQA